MLRNYHAWGYTLRTNIFMLEGIYKYSLGNQIREAYLSVWIPVSNEEKIDKKLPLLSFWCLSANLIILITLWWPREQLSAKLMIKFYSSVGRKPFFRLKYHHKMYVDHLILHLVQWQYPLFHYFVIPQN